ncbi:MAG: glycerophosphodiester phosphodiesterase, partial [Myxococcota bacterium]
MSGVGPTGLRKPSALALAGLASLWLGACAAPEHAGQAPIRLVGHRGALGLAPENTLAALERAAVLGLREVEVDIRRSRDGRLVLFHDATLDRKT